MAIIKIGHLNLKFTKAKGEDKQEITMIMVNTKIDTDQIVELGEYLLVVELNMDRVIEEGHNILTIIEVTLGEKILEEHKIIEV